MILRGTVFSKTLQLDTGITIVAPHMEKREEPYRVVYLLHGLMGNQDTWTDYSMLPAYASHGNTVYIMPEAGRSFYQDMKYGLNYFTYVAEELPELCKNLFRISAKREDTAVIGASMGGYGALKCALSKPERFGMCAAFSSGCLTMKEGLRDLRECKGDQALLDRFGHEIPADFANAFGPEYAYDPKNDVIELWNALGDMRPRIYLACGERDPFYADHLRLKEQIPSFDTDCTFESWDGGHNFFFFDKALNKAITYFDL